MVICKIRQKGIDLNHEFNVVVGKQCRTENAFLKNVNEL